MEIKQITKKNLLGAFLGGFIGLLVFGYSKNFWLLGSGVVFGATVGWCYQEIFCNIISIYKKLVIIGGKILSYARTKALGASQAIENNNAIAIRFISIIFCLVGNFLFIVKVFVLLGIDNRAIISLWFFDVGILSILFFSRDKRKQFYKRLTNYEDTSLLIFFLKDIISLFVFQLIWITLMFSLILYIV